MTKKLYYTDNHLYDFYAVVTEIGCSDEKQYFILNETAFFPEGGGQKSDTGSADGYKVTDVQECDGEICHFCEHVFNVGDTVHCVLDSEVRFTRMQAHSGEHIVSGLIYSAYGYDNVGFHMDNYVVTADFNGVLTQEMLAHVEKLANECVYKNVSIITEFPSAEKRSALHYRSKLDLKENVRIVTIDGYDCCACCAPHVSHTGEIGLIKITSAVSHRGGTRITILCGRTAFSDYLEKFSGILYVSKTLSVKQNETSQALDFLLAQNDSLKREITLQHSRYNKLLTDSVKVSDANIVVRYEDLSQDDLREIANAIADKCKGVCVVVSGDDCKGYAYVIVGKGKDMQTLAKVYNSALNGRGGGRGEMIQGSFCSDFEKINSYFMHGGEIQ